MNCLDAPRSNIFDPDNPDRPYVKGTTYELGVYPLEDVVVLLKQDGDVIATAMSDASGAFEFYDIIPGVYTITAEALYYTTREFAPESIWAGEDMPDFDIDLCNFHFEDDERGISTPHRFTPLCGAWEIVDDAGQPADHSIPHVYQGVDDDAVDSALCLCDAAITRFLFETKLKVHSSSGQRWQAGVVFCYKDEDNYYSFGMTPDTVYCTLIRDGHNVYTVSREVNSTTDIWHFLKVECDSVLNIIRVSHNGSILCSLFDSVYVDNKCGLWLSNFNLTTTAIVNFDDITILQK
jgi:hypothetical protein